MTNTDSTDILIQQIDNLLSDETMNQITALRLSLAVSRAILKQLNPMVKRVDIMWPVYKFGLWFFAVFGVSIIGLIVLLATGQAQIVVK